MREKYCSFDETVRLIRQANMAVVLNKFIWNKRNLSSLGYFLLSADTRSCVPACLAPFAWRNFGGIWMNLEEFVREKHCSEWKNKWIKPGLVPSEPTAALLILCNASGSCFYLQLWPEIWIQVQDKRYYVQMALCSRACWLENRNTCLVSSLGHRIEWPEICL